MADRPCGGIAVENSYRQEVDEYITRRYDERLNLQELNGESKRLLEEIKDLESKKNNMQSIEILKSPTRSPHPIKPRIRLNVSNRSGVIRLNQYSKKYCKP